MDIPYNIMCIQLLQLTKGIKLLCYFITKFLIFT